MIILRNSYFSENNKEEVLKEAKKLFKRDLTDKEKSYYSGKETSSQKRKRKYDALGLGAAPVILGHSAGSIVNLTKGYVDYDYLRGKRIKNRAVGTLAGLAVGIPVFLHFNKKIKKINEQKNSKVRLLRLQRGVTDIDEEIENEHSRKPSLTRFDYAPFKITKNY